jgi:hypothetical protein
MHTGNRLVVDPFHFEHRRKPTSVEYCVLELGGISMSSIAVVAPEETKPKLTKATPVKLRDAGVTESWLEDVIEKEPAVIGLGDDLAIVERQRRQEKAGRLDLLLEDDSGDRRYEVELMLGSTDESHLIRTIEYWDIERRKWPGYDHTAVLIAEELTARFLNVISLFSGSIPIIAIQVNGFHVDGKLVLHFVKVLDSRATRKDETTQLQAKATDRQYWISHASTATVELVDGCLEIINVVASTPRKLTYNKNFIGLNDGVRPGNFVTFKPRKSVVKISVWYLNEIEPWVKRLEESGLEVSSKNEGVRVILTPKAFDENKQLLTEMLHQCVRDYENG